jgi:hypothetical protein
MQTSICSESDDVPHSVQPCWYTSGTPPQRHLSSNQRPFTTIPGTTHKNCWFQRRMACGKNYVLYTVVLVCGTRNRSEWPLIWREVPLRWCSAGISEEEDEVACLTTLLISALTLLNSNWACLYLIQSGHNQHLICNLSSPWYGC